MRHARAQPADAFIPRDFDLLLTPTIPITAFAAGVDTPDATRLSAMVRLDAIDLAVQSHPPARGFRAVRFVEGLPIGLQVVGPMFGEEKILRASRCVEQACASDARPNLVDQPNVKV